MHVKMRWYKFKPESGIWQYVVWFFVPLNDTDYTRSLLFKEKCKKINETIRNKDWGYSPKFQEFYIKKEEDMLALIMMHDSEELVYKPTLRSRLRRVGL